MWGWFLCFFLVSLSAPVSVQLLKNMQVKKEEDSYSAGTISDPVSTKSVGVCGGRAAEGLAV